MDGYISRKQNSTTGYLFKNAHGDVLAAYSNTSNKLADYSYTAWGEQRSVNETSSFTNNPLRYCGEYYDCESGMTYLRARYYDSNIKRFISEDPIKDGLNWYSYAGNNPVMFVDPSGLELILQGTGDEVQSIWQRIKEFSYDVLELTQLTDDNDNLINQYRVTIAENRDGVCVSGTDLIRRLIGYDETINVQTTSDENSYNNETQTVFFNPNYNRDVLTRNPYNGNIELCERPMFIGLAHEFIHADRDVRGVSLTGWVDYQYVREERPYTFGSISSQNSIYSLGRAPREELATVGIQYNSDVDITENMIRAEHGLWLRGAY